ncbi:hypothetical protein [Streptomyces coeruleorubidus]|uniref:hypothetical protein n=1 Tax=Streptomyces coeruleorubidus TaxID=116188 RepID=UPI0036901827
MDLSGTDPEVHRRPVGEAGNQQAAQPGEGFIGLQRLTEHVGDDDASTAYTQARRLCALLEQEDAVWLTAELPTAADVRRMAALLPGVTFGHPETCTDPETGRCAGFDLDVTTADDAALEAHLPLDVIEEVPPGSLVARFATALGRGAAAVEWHGRWPDEPAAGHYGSPPYDGVQVVFHGDRAQRGR